MTDDIHPVYEVRIRDYLEARWLSRLADETVVRYEDGETIISGPMDQAALHGVLNLIRDLGMELVAVESMNYRAGADRLRS